MTEDDAKELAELLAGRGPTLAELLAPCLDLDAGYAEIIQHASADRAVEKLGHLQRWLNEGAIVSLRHAETLQGQSDAWHELAAVVATVAVACAHAGADAAKLAELLAARTTQGAEGP